MSKVFFSVTMSLDGYMAPIERPGELYHPEWEEAWSRLQAWAFRQEFLRQNLQIGEGGETGPVNDLLRETFERTGATVIGRRMFDAGAEGWPEEAPFHTDVFVVTHRPQEPWKRPGGTTFHFVDGGIHEALDRARESAGDRDVRIGGGANTIQQYLRAGLVDEFTLAVPPVILGSGLPLFDSVDPHSLGLEAVGTLHSPEVTHLHYSVAA